MDPFIERWQNSGAAERANYALFLTELCDYLELPHPDPAVADNARNAYVFERPVTFRHPTGLTSPGFIDLYKRGCFVLEAKQGSEAAEPSLLFEMPRRRGTAVRETTGWDQAMMRARNQAEQYAKALPTADGWPPFLIVVDVGYSFELFADFSGTGKAYVPFPDSLTHRIRMERLESQLVRDRLRAVWLDPLSLDPSRISARVTRDVAWHLANLARSLEQDHPPEAVTPFLMRCIFTFFAEDIQLLPRDSFSNLLDSLRNDLGNFKPLVESLWRSMDGGSYSDILRMRVLRFNGGLFESIEALPLNRKQFDILCLAAKADWKDVEPAIFGTLLERALDPRERHSLGAHYTPAPTWNGWSSLPSSSRSARIGRTYRRRRSRWSASARAMKPSRSWPISAAGSAPSKSLTRPAAPAIFSTSRSNISSASKAKSTTRWKAWAKFSRRCARPGSRSIRIN